MLNLEDGWAKNRNTNFLICWLNLMESRTIERMIGLVGCGFEKSLRSCYIFVLMRLRVWRTGSLK